MWFKNLKIFRLSKDFTITANQLEKLLLKEAFIFDENDNSPIKTGFVSFFEEEGTLVHKVEKSLMFKVRIERKLLPSAVVNQAVKEKVEETEATQGYKVGKKQTKEIKEGVIASLLTKAFSVPKDIMVAFDLDNQWMIIDTSANTISDEVIGLLAKVLDPLPILSYMTKQSPTSCMTSWLLDGTAPDNFTIDHDIELKSMIDSRIRVRYDNNSPEHDELSKHTKAGKTCTRLSMTWNDRVSFTLNDAGDIRRITPLKILAMSKENINSDDYIEHFDAEMTLMFGELNELLNDLTGALGGEKNEQH